MRNLKRALSLALASVMLLGMMVVGSSAAFADADEIVNTEAVEITAGLKIFEGTDGKFNPKGTVTRAQMATVIVKMLYGSEINADQFKGTGKFSDTAAFEGGWAEGYINLCANLGIVKGYGDGTFKPGQAVTTAEAVTMIINALGVDAGAGTWPMTVMAKAEEIELFEDMEGAKPGTYAEMTRDQLAVAVWNGLNYSAEGVQGYKVLGSDITFKSWSDAAAYADAAYGVGSWTAAYVSEVKNDTLAETVFEIESATGFITDNQATGEKYTTVAGLNVNLETGLDQLGHFVTVYYKETYKNENKPGVAYCIVEEADYVKVAKAITADKKDYLAAFGTKVDSVTNPILMSFNNAGFYMEFDTTVGADNSAYLAAKPTYNKNTSDASTGTYVIDSESGVIIAHIAPTAFTFEEVLTVKTTAGKEAIRITNHASLDNNADDDVVVEYDGIAEGDIVVVKNFLGMTYLEKPEIVTGKINKTATKTIDGAPVNFTYIDGKEYENGAAARVGAGVPVITGANFDAQISGTNTYDAYTYGGKLYGVKLTSSTANLVDTIYVVDNYSTVADGAYGATTTSYFAQGIDANGKEVSVLIGMSITGTGMVDDVNDGGTGVNNIPAVTSVAPGFYTFEKSLDKDMAKKNIMTAKAAATKASFDAVNSTDLFFADTVSTAAGLTIDKDVKSLAIAGGAANAYITAETKFVVVDNTTYSDELEIATYTGTMNKTLTSSDIVKVAVTEDAEENYILAVVMIETNDTVLDAADFIYVVDANASAIGSGKFEYKVYMTETNEFATIIADSNAYTAGLYANFELDPEDNVYNLGAVEAATTAQVKLAQLLTGTYGNLITSTSLTDIALADDVAIVDIRDAENLEDAEVSEITTVNELKGALKSGARVYFNALVDNTGADPVVTHIFVYSVQVESYKGANDWHESNL